MGGSHHAAACILRGSLHCQVSPPHRTRYKSDMLLTKSSKRWQAAIRIRTQTFRCCPWIKSVLRSWQPMQPSLAPSVPDRESSGRPMAASPRKRSSCCTPWDIRYNHSFALRQLNVPLTHHHLVVCLYLLSTLCRFSDCALEPRHSTCCVHTRAQLY